MSMTNKGEQLVKENPLVRAMSEGKEITWINDQLTDYETAAKGVSLSLKDVDDAADRLDRFAPFIRICFPETEPENGIIESPIREIMSMKDFMNAEWNAGLSGKLMLKMDSHLAAAGSVKARGGIYEILKYAESLAIKNGMIRETDSYAKFADPEMKKFFSQYSIHVGSTGNLGLSIGIMSATLGFNVNVHMSADAKQWKKDLLRRKGANVVEYAGDYGKAVKEGRALAEKDPMSYFVDDENSVSLFLGYAVAARRLKKQLAAQNVPVDKDHPLFVYIPCGVGGAPGGIAFGLKQEFKDDVNVFFVEPTEACCMALGMATDLHNEISVQDIGLSGMTDADGLAVGRASGFVGKTIRHMLAGEVTLKDEKLYRYMKALYDTEKVFIEPSSCAAFEGVTKIETDPDCRAYLEKQGLSDKMKNATHIAWATGGSLVPEETRNEYFKKAEALSRA